MPVHGLSVRDQAVKGLDETNKPHGSDDNVHTREIAEVGFHPGRGWGSGPA